MVFSASRTIAETFVFVDCGVAFIDCWILKLIVSWYVIGATYCKLLGYHQVTQSKPTKTDQNRPKPSVRKPTAKLWITSVFGFVFPKTEANRPNLRFWTEFQPYGRPTLPFLRRHWPPSSVEMELEPNQTQIHKHERDVTRREAPPL